MEGARYRELAERAVSWVASRVHHDEGIWFPSVVDDNDLVEPRSDYPHSIYLGTAGLILLLEEVKLTRDLTTTEELLRESIGDDIATSSMDRTLASLYVGLAGDATVMRMLDRGDDLAALLVRLEQVRGPRGWTYPSGDPQPPVYDLLAGAAGVALTGVWCGGSLGLELARIACEQVLAGAIDVGDGLDWLMFEGDKIRMPNYSHGTAGIATALAIAGSALDQPRLIEAAIMGATHLLAIGDLKDGRLVIPQVLPLSDDHEAVAFGWCHGSAGTSYLFSALEEAGVAEVGGHDVRELRHAALRAVLESGIPERLRPGFWDNDGRCCGTAGVGDVMLDAAQLDSPSPSLAREYLTFAMRLGDALIERAVVDAEGARWRFIEHRKEPSLQPPQTGWSQGAAGIAAFLFRLARVVDDGLGVRVVDRPDQWWAVPHSARSFYRT